MGGNPSVPPPPPPSVLSSLSTMQPDTNDLRIHFWVCVCVSRSFRKRSLRLRMMSFTWTSWRLLSVCPTSSCRLATWTALKISTHAGGCSRYTHTLNVNICCTHSSTRSLLDFVTCQIHRLCLFNDTEKINSCVELLWRDNFHFGV